MGYPNFIALKVDADFLQLLCERGTHVLLSWGEDDDVWHCEFITGGVRYHADEPTPNAAMRAAYEQAAQVALRADATRILNAETHG